MARDKNFDTLLRAIVLNHADYLALLVTLTEQKLLDFDEFEKNRKIQRAESTAFLDTLHEADPDTILDAIRKRGPSIH